MDAIRVNIKKPHGSNCICELQQNLSTSQKLDCLLQTTENQQRIQEVQINFKCYELPVPTAFYTYTTPILHV